MNRYTLHNDDNMNVLRAMPDNSVDSIVTDPPYGISLMGKKWDHDVPSVELWTECLRVLKPGGHLLAFAGTRTQHRMAVRIEDAGFEIRDMICWLYGQGFPKSVDISKHIDKRAGVEREVVGHKITGRANAPREEGRNHVDCGVGQMIVDVTKPATEEAKKWEGWGTSLKPSMEPITLARKPFSTTIAENVLTYGTGGLNIEACRVGTESVTINTWDNGAKPFGNGAGNPFTSRISAGRWPANTIHDGSNEVVELFPDAGGGFGKRGGGDGGAWNPTDRGTKKGQTIRGGMELVGYGDTGSAARFFYSAKASRADRDQGLDSTYTVKYTPLVQGKPCKDVSTVLVRLLQKATSGSTLRWHIGESGESITGLCPLDSLSTIATRINKTTESKILSLLTHSIISDCVADARSATVSGGNPAANAAKSSVLPTAITPERLEELALGVRNAASTMLYEISDAANWKPKNNGHATVKPTQLMRYLCRLVTPPDGIVLDPFMGSGSTGKAALLEGFRFIGIEREPEYMAIAERRIAHASREMSTAVSVTRDVEPVKQEQTDKGQLSLFGGK